MPRIARFIRDNQPTIYHIIKESGDISRYFVEIYGTPPGKAERLKEIMGREQVSAESLLFIGDKISDYKAAMVVGVRFLGRLSEDFQTVFPEGTKCIEDFLYCNLDDFYPAGTGQKLLYRGVSQELDEKCSGKLRPKGSANSICMRYNDHKNFRHDGKFLYGESENNAVRAHHLNSGMHNGCYVSTTRNKKLAEKFATNNFTCDGFIYVIDESKLEKHGVVAWEFFNPEYDEQEVSLRAHNNGDLPSGIIIEKYEVKTNR